MNIISVYQCDHCGFYKKTKKSVQEHEKRCFRNPATKSCATCLWGYCLPETKCGGGVELNGTLKTQCSFHIDGEMYMESYEVLVSRGVNTPLHEEIIAGMKDLT
jgi:hypothetical protein